MDGLFGDLRAQLFGRDERAWAGSVEDLLFDGESVAHTVAMGDNRVVVTTHRLLAFTPDLDGENYRQVDLPNVTDVRAGHVGEDDLLMQAARVGLYGVVLLAVGVFVDFEAFVPTGVFAGTGTGASRLGLGSLIGLMQSMLNLLAQIDDIARMIGALLLLLGVFIVGVYMLTRDRVVLVAVAGDGEDIAVPPGEGSDAVDDAVAELERVLFESGDAGVGNAPGGFDDSSGNGQSTTGGFGDADDATADDAGFKSDDPL